MKYSIIIPAYNSAEYIHNALDSIEMQTFKDYEVIVVCDSCTDETENIARSYGARTASVSYHCDGPTRNKGLELARGDWVLFMDDDDWWLHEFVLEQLNGVLNDNIDVLCFSFIFHGVKYAPPRGNGGHHWTAAWNKAYRRSAIGGARFSSVTDGSADVEFFATIFSNGLRITDWDMPLYYYNYFRDGSISQRLGYDYRRKQ